VNCGSDLSLAGLRFQASPGFVQDSARISRVDAEACVPPMGHRICATTDCSIPTFALEITATGLGAACSV